jgi:hypothetical protein
LGIDSFLPSFVCPAEGDECFVVRGRRVGDSVEISLSRCLHQRHHGSDEYTLIELIAVRRFAHADSALYRGYANRLEDAARYASRGDLGYSVLVGADGPALDVSLVARLLTETGEIHTEVSHQHHFEDADSNVTLIAANEKATELRALAQQLNENWSALHQARLLEIQAKYEQADRDAESASALQRIVESESP